MGFISRDMKEILISLVQNLEQCKDPEYFYGISEQTQQNITYLITIIRPSERPMIEEFFTQRLDSLETLGFITPFDDEDVNYSDKLEMLYDIYTDMLKNVQDMIEDLRNASTTNISLIEDIN